MSRRLQSGKRQLRFAQGDHQTPLVSKRRRRQGIQRRANPGFGQGATLTPIQAEALSWLTNNWQTPIEIARRVKLDSPKVRGRIATLVSKGLAERDLETGAVRRARA